MAPPTFGDLGKSAKDLFNKGYSQFLDNIMVATDVELCRNLFLLKSRRLGYTFSAQGYSFSYTYAVKPRNIDSHFRRRSLQD